VEIGEFHNKVNDPQVAQLLDNILDAVLSLKARLRDSNMDSNSIGGTSISARYYSSEYFPSSARQSTILGRA
jgi:hypothetical protein